MIEYKTRNKENNHHHLVSIPNIEEIQIDRYKQPYPSLQVKRICVGNKERAENDEAECAL